MKKLDCIKDGQCILNDRGGCGDPICLEPDGEAPSGPKTPDVDKKKGN